MKEIKLQDAGTLKLLCRRVGLSRGPGGRWEVSEHPLGEGEGRGRSGRDGDRRRKHTYFIGWSGELSDVGQVRSWASTMLRKHDFILQRALGTSERTLDKCHHVLFYHMSLCRSWDIVTHFMEFHTEMIHEVTESP